MNILTELRLVATLIRVGGAAASVSTRARPLRILSFGGRADAGIGESLVGGGPLLHRQAERGPIASEPSSNLPEKL